MVELIDRAHFTSDDAGRPETRGLRIDARRPRRAAASRHALRPFSNKNAAKSMTKSLTRRRYLVAGARFELTTFRL
jgi:hypothetical protein